MQQPNLALNLRNAHTHFTLILLSLTLVFVQTKLYLMIRLFLMLKLNVFCYYYNTSSSVYSDPFFITWKINMHMWFITFNVVNMRYQQVKTKAQIRWLREAESFWLHSLFTRLYVSSLTDQKESEAPGNATNTFRSMDGSFVLIQRVKQQQQQQQTG